MTGPSDIVNPHDHAAQVLAALRSAPVAPFEPLATVARQLLDTSIAAVNFIEGDMQWTKVASGVIVPPLPRKQSLCSTTVCAQTPLLITDAAQDARFAGVEMVRSGAVRFYAGVPLRVTDPLTGQKSSIGALCIADPTPRTIDAAKVAALRALGDLAESLIEAHMAAQHAIEIAALANSQSEALTRQRRIFAHAERMAMVGSWRLVVGSHEIEWSQGLRNIHELSADTPATLNGALDYYPPHSRELIASTLAESIRTGEPFNIDADLTTARGRARRVRITGELEHMADGTVAMIGVLRDITERYLLEQQLRRSASTDAVTGIANRAAFNVAIERAIDRVCNDGASCTLVLIDLDRFKEINDTFGHPAGDDVLRMVGTRLQADYLGNALAARLGGDEFALIVTDAEDCARIDTLVARLLADLARPVVRADDALTCSATIGYAAFTPGVDGSHELIRRADIALYDAKRRGRGTASAYSPPGADVRRGH